MCIFIVIVAVAAKHLSVGVDVRSHTLDNIRHVHLRQDWLEPVLLRTTLSDRLLRDSECRHVIAHTATVRSTDGLRSGQYHRKHR